MVKIRLKRMGAKHNPHYRIVVVDARQKRDSSYLEQIGYYDPRETSDTPVKVDVERASHWLERGAQPSDTVVRILEKAGVDVPGVRVKRSAAYLKRPRAET